MTHWLTDNFKSRDASASKNVLFWALPEKGGWVVGVDWGEGAARITRLLNLLFADFLKKKVYMLP